MLSKRTGRLQHRVCLLAAFLLAGGFAVGCDGWTEPPNAQTSAAKTTGGQPSETPAPGDHELALTWDGEQRTYQVHAPPSYDPARRLPAVVAIHFRGGDPAALRQTTGLDALADRKGFLVVYPNGAPFGALNALICCGSRDDVGYIKAIVNHMIDDWNADPDRIYATGLSIGADMTYRLAVEAPGVFAAIAPVSGGFIGPRATTDETFKPSTPVSVITFIGENDQASDTLLAGLQTWRRRLGCVTEASQTIDARRSVHRTTSGCADGSEVVAYLIEDMGHSWPGGAAGARLANPRTAIAATELMWEFFVDHPRQ